MTRVSEMLGILAALLLIAGALISGSVYQTPPPDHAASQQAD